jgi:hypothetical protein
LKTFLEGTIRDAVTYTEHAKRKTVTSLDVVYALKRQGRTLYVSISSLLPSVLRHVADPLLVLTSTGFRKLSIVSDQPSPHQLLHHHASIFAFRSYPPARLANSFPLSPLRLFFLRHGIFVFGFGQSGLRGIITRLGAGSTVSVGAIRVLYRSLGVLPLSLVDKDCSSYFSRRMR